MRLSNQLIADISLKYIQENIERLEQLRMHADSTNKFQKTSDDPSNASSSDSLKSSLAANQAYIETAQMTDEWMNINEIAMHEIENLATRALNLTESWMSQGVDHTSLHVFQTEFETILQQTLDAANSKHQGKYVFAGTKIDIQPFTLNSPPSSVTYNGDGKEIIQSLGPNEKVTINIDGQEVFRTLFNALIRGINTTLKSDLKIIAEDLQTALDTIRQTRIINSARQRQVISAIDQGNKTDFLLQTLLQSNEDVCIVDVLKDLKQQEITYQTALEVSTRTLATMNMFVLM
jgi:flagellar hook-associated protein 3 FlgL